MESSLSENNKINESFIWRIYLKDMRRLREELKNNIKI
jgi:hypothetical protein